MEHQQLRLFILILNIFDKSFAQKTNFFWDFANFQLENQFFG